MMADHNSTISVARLQDALELARQQQQPGNAHASQAALPGHGSQQDVGAGEVVVCMQVSPASHVSRDQVVR